MRLFRSFIFTILLLLPVFSHAEVIINEIAWMGTAESSNAEWVELYNTGNTDVDLTGWKLYEAGGGTLIISLAKSLSAGGYFLIERVTPSVPDSVPGINDISGSFGGSGLSNSGEHLVLKDSAENIIHSLNFSTGWTAGDSTTKKTMQWNGSIWITASSTPGIINISTSSSTSDTTDETATTTSQTANTTTPSNQTTPTIISAHSSPVPLSSTENKIEFEISAGRDRLAMVGNKLVFKAVPTKLQNMSESGITYFWSFGDGTIAQGNNISHAYKFAGDYSVVVNANYSDKQAVSRSQVKIISPNISLAKIPEGTEIFNKSETEINLENWSLVSPRKTFVFPADTLIPKGKKITFADDTTGMSDETIQLINPLGKEFGSIKRVETEETKPAIINSESINLSEIQAKIEEVKNAITQIYEKSQLSKSDNETGATSFTSISESTKTGLALTPVLDVGTNIKENVDQTINTATVFEATQQKGFVSTIFSWPIKGFEFVRQLFVGE